MEFYTPLSLGVMNHTSDRGVDGQVKIIKTLTVLYPRTIYAFVTSHNII